MVGVVADTHVIVWYLGNDPNLSAAASFALDEAVRSGELIQIPSICLVEITYLVEKGRLPDTAKKRLFDTLDGLPTTCRVEPLTRQVAEAIDHILGSDVADLPDRIIAATAFALGLPLVTRDRRIRSSVIETIW